LESLIRLSEAFAKMRLGQEVNEDDVERAVTLMMNATLKSATDPSTGIIDMGIINTGRSTAIKHRIDEVAEFSKLMLLANEAKYRKSTFLEQFMEDFNRHPTNQKMAVTRDEFLEAFRLLQTNDLIAMFGANKANPQFKLQHSLEM
jgi:DNA replication licensing factor MCM4